MNVEAVMTRDPLTVSASASLDDAMRLMSEHSLRHLPVVRDGALVGIVSNRDLLEATGWSYPYARPTDKGDPAGAAVEEVMTTPVTSVHPKDTILAASLELVLRKIGCLPVVDEGRLTGILTERDLLKAWIDSCADDAEPGERDTPVSVVTTRNLLTLPRKATLQEAVDLCRAERINHLPIAEGGKLLGFLSDRDLKAATGRGQDPNTPVGKLIKGEVCTLPEDATLYQAATLMYERVFSGVPIVSGDGSELVGLVTISDLLGR